MQVRNKHTQSLTSRITHEHIKIRTVMDEKDLVDYMEETIPSYKDIHGEGKILSSNYDIEIFTTFWGNKTMPRIY